MSQLVWYSVVSTHHTMTLIWGSVEKEHFFKKKKIIKLKKKKMHNPPHDILRWGRQAETLQALAMGAEAVLKTGDQCSGEREGRFVARHLHLNTMGPSRPRNLCPCHSYCLMRCSFWCGGTFTYIKLTEDRQDGISVQHGRPFCVWLSQQQKYFSDRWVCTEPKTFKMGNRDTFSKFSKRSTCVLPPWKDRENN